MYISDILFSQEIPTSTKHAVLDIMDREHIAYDIQVLIPTSTNDDVNGSTHVRAGGTDFTYQDATIDDARDATGLGYYAYFGAYGIAYTGHYYQGGDSKFPALVIDPPTYAVTVQIAAY